MTSERDYRNALGQFPTGVAIVTTRDENYQDVGLTINSFSSVSLEPKIVTWSLASNANSKDAFSRAEYFAIHVLGEHQESLSTLFAKKIPEKFDGIGLEDSDYDIPLLPNYSSRFVCRRLCSFQLGDHLVFAGVVEHFSQMHPDPLVFVKGRYAKALDLTAVELQS